MLNNNQHAVFVYATSIKDYHRKLKALKVLGLRVISVETEPYTDWLIRYSASEVEQDRISRALPVLSVGRRWIEVRGEQDQTMTVAMVSEEQFDFDWSSPSRIRMTIGEPDAQAQDGQESVGF